MKASMIVPMAGNPMVEIGQVVEGEEAVRLCAAGFAVPIVETEAPEKATRKRVAKETRKAD